MFWREFPRPPATSALAAEALLLSRAMMGATVETLGTALNAPTTVERYCHALTSATPHLPLVWAWFGNARSEVIFPQVAAGRGVAWARGLRIDRNALTCRGPAFRALDGQPSEPFSVSRLSLWAPWRDAARTQGIRSVLCVPLQPGPQHSEGGVLVLYADTPDYFDGLTEFFESLAAMFGSILAQAAAHSALSRAATTDALTGLGNRLQLEQVNDALRQRRGDAAPTAVVIVDLDKFKSVNDTYGHEAGDTVLKGTAEQLLSGVRQTDAVVRLGGEEFVLVLQGTTGAQAVDVAEALRGRLEACRHRVGAAGALQVTGSFGVAQLESGETLDAAVRRADAALYAAKHQGRNRVCLALPVPELAPARDSALT
jgi:diguanylate cyclase (GGDEF)-like protein